MEEEKKEILTWNSCCLKTDRQAVVYFGQLSFAFTVLAFSASMLVMADGDCNKSSPYIGLISFLLGKLLSTVTDSSHRWMNKKPTEISFSNSMTDLERSNFSKENLEPTLSKQSFDIEPLNLMECVEIHKPTQQKEIIYTEQMIRDIFMSEYLKQNSIKNI